MFKYTIREMKIKTTVKYRLSNLIGKTPGVSQFDFVGKVMQKLALPYFADGSTTPEEETCPYLSIFHKYLHFELPIPYQGIIPKIH